jgi:hypothetical protein
LSAYILARGWTRWFHKKKYVAFKLSHYVRDNSTVDLYPSKKCVRLLKQSGEVEHEKKGTMLLSIDYCPTISKEDEPIAVVSSFTVALCGEI